jgi:hypothetical protein
MGAKVYPDLARLMADPVARPTVIVVPLHLGPAALAKALNRSWRCGPGAKNTAPWWQLLSMTAAPLLVFFEGRGEGLLTAARLLKPAHRPVPGESGGWAEKLCRYQLHTGGAQGEGHGGCRPAWLHACAAAPSSSRLVYRHGHSPE